MLIRTQDKQRLVRAIEIHVQKDTSKKCYLCARYSTGTFFYSGECTLGLYPSMEEALLELDRIQEYFRENRNGIYEMS